MFRFNVALKANSLNESPTSKLIMEKELIINGLELKDLDQTRNRTQVLQTSTLQSDASFLYPLYNLTTDSLETY